MRIYNLNLDTHGEDITATYKIGDDELINLTQVIHDIRDHIQQHLKRDCVLRLAVRPNLPIPMYAKDPLYMYVQAEDLNLASLLEKKMTVESQKHVIRNQESLLEDLMFGIVRQDNERIPYRLDCDTYLQFNINGNTIDVMVICNTVDLVVPNEWEGEFETLLEKVEDLLVSHGFNRGFGTTPTINPLRV
jgi:hypothetical protein